MKAAIVTKFPRNPLDPCGGVEAVSVKLVGALAMLEDLEVHVVTTDPTASALERQEWKNVTIHRLPQGKLKLLRFASGPGRQLVSDYLKTLRPDVVHSHDIYGLMVKGLEMPRVFTVHGFIHEDTRVNGGQWSMARAWMWRQLETAAWADQPHIISISPYVREYVRQFTKARFHNIDNPVGEEFFSIPRKEKFPRIFCAAGGICARKNVLGLVQAYAEMKAMGARAALHISGGPADKPYYERVRQFVRESGIEDDVTFLGRISHQQICDELSAASFFALVSMEENAPVSIEEAMAAGVPVLTSNRCGMPYMVDDSVTGALIDPEDPKDMAAGMKQLLEIGDQRQKMGQRAKATATARFHPHAVACRTRDVYYRALGRRSATAADGAPMETNGASPESPSKARQEQSIGSL